MTKKIYLAIFFLTVCTFNNMLYADVIVGCDAESWVSGAEKILVNQDDQSIRYIKYKVPIPFQEPKLGTWVAQLHNSNADNEFVLYQTETDKLGMVHYRFRQYYKGVRVRNAVFYVHTKNQKIVSANGDYVSNLQINTQPRLSAEEALQIGKENMQGVYAWKTEEFPTPELMVFIKNKTPYLAYQTDIYTTRPLERNYLFIEADNGKIIDKYNRIHHAHADGEAETRYSGTRTIAVDSLNPSSFRLRDYSRGNGVITWDMNTSTDYFSAVDFTDVDNYWNTTTNKDDAAYDTHWGATAMYDYLWTEHGRNSYDNAGAIMNSYVHLDLDYNNAFWDGSGFSYGDGDGDGTELDPLTSIDVVSHEIMHAVTEYSAGLIYQDE